MNAATVGAAAAAGVLVGPRLRASILALSPSPGNPERPHCPQCNAGVISPGVRTGIGRLAADSRCRGCGQRVGPPRGAVELATGASFGLLAVRVHPLVVLVAVCGLTAAGVVLAFVDVRVGRLPNVIVGPAFAAVGGLLVVAAVVAGDPGRLLRALLAAAACFAAFSLVAVVSSGLGFGDVKLAGLLGLAWGWFGWGAVIAGMILGFVVAALWLLPAMLSGRLARSDRVPFGPFMLVAALVVILLVA